MSWRKLKIKDEEWLWQCNGSYIRIKAPSGKTSLIETKTVAKFCDQSAMPVKKEFTLATGAEDFYWVYVIKPSNLTKYIIDNRDKLIKGFREN